MTDSGLISATANDIITAFAKGADKIDLSALDANASTSANDAFTFINASAFSATKGQLHYVVSGANIILEGDVTGDSVADFQIQINGITSIGAGDIIL